MLKPAVLVVDDDPVSLGLTRHLVESVGYAFQSARSVADALRIAARTPPDAAIVDLVLGHDNGLDLVRRWRVERRFPVLIVSARGEPIDRVIGLEVGADDYLVKPVEPRELQLRLRIALERWAIGSCLFDAARRAIRIDGADVALTTAEHRLIELLVRNANQVLTRDRIMDAVQQRERFSASDRSVDMLVNRLRRKVLADDFSIQSIRGAGYMLCGAITRVA
jgi:two-component system phosphate regulon response regulator OmpR